MHKMWLLPGQLVQLVQLVECHTFTNKIARSIPRQRTYLGCMFNPRYRCETNWSIFLSDIDVSLPLNHHPVSAILLPWLKSCYSAFSASTLAAFSLFSCCSQWFIFETQSNQVISMFKTISGFPLYLQQNLSFLPWPAICVPWPLANLYLFSGSWPAYSWHSFHPRSSVLAVPSTPVLFPRIIAWLDLLKQQMSPPHRGCFRLPQLK